MTLIINVYYPLILEDIKISIRTKIVFYINSRNIGIGIKTNFSVMSSCSGFFVSIIPFVLSFSVASSIPFSSLFCIVSSYFTSIGIVPCGRLIMKSVSPFFVLQYPIYGMWLVGSVKFF